MNSTLSQVLKKGYIDMENNENRGLPGSKFSRRAQLLALKNHVDLSTLVGTGPEGRIIENDVLRAIEERNRPAVQEPEAPVAEPVEQTPAVEDNRAEETTPAPTETVIAEEAPVEEALVEEASAEEAPAEEAPAEEVIAEEKAIIAAPVTAVCAEKEEPASEDDHACAEKEDRSAAAYRHTDVILSPSEDAPDGTPITIGMSFDATSILGLRTKIKEHGEAMGLPSVTLNDMILFAVAKTLKKHKALNAHFLGDKIRYFDGAHLSFAVDTESGPEMLTVFDADRLSLASLSKITGTLIRGVRAGNGSPEKNRRAGSFTVTNVGTLGVESFTPVLKAPQTGILGVCALSARVKNVNGKDVVYSAMPLTLTFDPRAMSTANAAKFLRELCAALENFGLLLIK